MAPQPLSNNHFEPELYKQACDDHRFYGDMRFKQLSLFALISGFLFNALNNTNTAQRVIAISLCGLITTMVIWVMEVRSSLHGQSARARKRRLEAEVLLADSGQADAKEDEFKPKWRLFNATFAVLLLYAFAYLSWMGIWLSQLDSCRLLPVGILLGFLFVVLAIFSVREYTALLRDAIKYWRW